jgi:hypothetical protein
MICQVCGEYSATSPCDFCTAIEDQYAELEPEDD